MEWKGVGVVGDGIGVIDVDDEFDDDDDVDDDVQPVFHDQKIKFRVRI